MQAALQHVELSVAGNESSDLLPVRSPEVLAAHGATRGFWTVLDEGPAEACVALLLQSADGSWSAHHQAFDAGVENGRTEDGEALAWHDGWVYVVGSHFGSKGGPLRPKRAFFGRFREADAVAFDSAVRLDLVRNQFRLHRAINDALVAAGITPLPPGNRVQQQFIAQTRTRGASRSKSWVEPPGRTATCRSTWRRPPSPRPVRCWSACGSRSPTRARRSWSRSPASRGCSTPTRGRGRGRYGPTP